MLNETLLKPISRDSPCGRSLRFDAVWHQIEEALREDDDLPQGEWGHKRKVVDVDLVIRLTESALVSDSKDLQLAVWRAQSLARRSGLPGLVEGLTFVRDLLTTYWELVYPVAGDGDLESRLFQLISLTRKLTAVVRLIPLNRDRHDWFSFCESRTRPLQGKDDVDDPADRISAEQFDRAVSATPNSFYERLQGDLASALTALKELDLACRTLFSYENPNFSSLLEALNELAFVTSKILADRQAHVRDEQTVRPSSPPIANKSALVFAAELRLMNPTDPTPYLLVRAYRWGELRGLGQLSPELLKPPTLESRERLKSVHGSSHWNDLLALSEAEMATPVGCGWLDLQRYSSVACEAIGGKYNNVKEAITDETGALLRRFPELPKLMLADGTSAADVLTREWLNRALGYPLPEITPSGRSRFLDKFNLAKRCLTCGQDAVGVTLLEQVVREIDSRKLDEWEECGLIVEPILLLYNKLRSSRETDERTRVLFARLCQLSPQTALQQSLPDELS